MRSVEAFMLVYSITSKRSFTEVERYAAYIERTKDQKLRDLPCIFIGNKADLGDKERQVSYAELQQLAFKYGAKYMEVSAKTAKNVKQAFELLTLQTLQWRLWSEQHKTQSKSNDKKCITM